ncbi:putative membrane protein [Collimonas pratensis]|uniref:Putative membrane protein n=1 Tax=Collimonas pratensis TaxID=279113 RepID=A0A127Q6R5_9BURK|nr:putative membrane protein [Collimonas pratensis]
MAIAYIVGATLKLGVVGIGALLVLKVLLVAGWLAYGKKRGSH